CTECVGVGAGAFCLVLPHETPGESRVRALPSPYRARAVVSPEVSCRRARSHAVRGASTRTVSGLWMTLGTSRAQFWTAAGTAVDNPAACWGRLVEQEITLPGATCSEGPPGSCGQEKVADAVSRPDAILRAMSTQKSPDSSRPPVTVVRSPRRRKTVTAYRQGETVVVLLPARMSRREEDHWVATMLERLERRAHRVVPGDAELERRARPLGPRRPEGGGEQR